jgi:hypothetical protein
MSNYKKEKMNNEVLFLDPNLPNADQEGLEVPNIVNEYNEENFEIDEEAHSDMQMPYLGPELILEENDVIMCSKMVKLEKT